jgi:hypothetical protein
MIDIFFSVTAVTKLMKEGVLLKRFVEAVIVNGRVTHEPAKYLKSKGKKAEKQLERY